MENKRKISVISVIDNSRNVIEYFLDIGLPIKKEFEDSIVVMSRLTWIYCQKKECCPKDCIIYVMDENTTNEENTGPQKGGLKEYNDIINIHKDKNVYIVGGQHLISMFIPICDQVILSKLSFDKPGRYKKYKCLDDTFVLDSNIRQNTLCTEMTYIRNNNYIHPELNNLDLIKKVLGSPESLYCEKVEYNVSHTFPLFSSKYTNYLYILDVLLKILEAKTTEHEIYEPALEWSKNINNAIIDLNDQTNIVVYGIKKNKITNSMCHNIACQLMRNDTKVSLVVYIQIQNVLTLNDTVCFYSFLLNIICKLSNDAFTPGKITLVVGELFNYKTKFEETKLKNMLNSSQKPFPVLKINQNFKTPGDFIMHGLN